MVERLNVILSRAFRAPAVRYPPDPRTLFFLIVCALSGPALAFFGATPGTIEAQLEPWQVALWGIALSVGSVVTLIGIARPTPNGILIEQVGSVSVMVAAGFYAACILNAVAWKGFVPASIGIALAASCAWRWFQLQLYLDQIEHAVRQAREAANRPDGEL